MGHPDDYQYYLSIGCRDVSHCLGIHKMPEGYALMLNADESHFFGMEISTGTETADHWDKWAIYRWAKSRATRQQEQPR